MVYEDYQMVKLTQPYIPGFLAFREVPHLLVLLQKLRKNRPDLVPGVIFMDGNGVLHPRGCGVACHFGVVADIPTLGVAKTCVWVQLTAKAHFSQTDVRRWSAERNGQTCLPREVSARW